jgi:hypothetical protein
LETYPRGTAEFWLGLCDVTLCRFSLMRQHDEASEAGIDERHGLGEQAVHGDAIHAFVHIRA